MVNGANIMIPDEMDNKPVPSQIVYQLSSPQVLRAVVIITLLAGMAVVLATERTLPDQLETLLLLAVGSLFEMPSQTRTRARNGQEETH